MTTLIKQLENITATQDDDYFSTEYKLDVLNDAKSHIIQTGIAFEKTLKRSLRFLDPLRVTQSLSASSPVGYEDFYVYEVSFPNDLNDWLYLEGATEHLVELQTQYQLKHGNAQPSKFEGYYIVFDNKFNVYSATDDETAYTLHYFKTHTEVQEADETFTEINGGDAQKATLYYAAMLLSSTDATLPKETYQGEYNKFIKDLI